jgi:GNAT superfamily N-acetyltransferase
MNLPTSELLYLVGEAITILFRGTAGLEARLTRYGSLVLSGEPYADCNYITIDAGPEPEALLREYYAVAQSRHLPVLILLAEAVAERLAPTAQALGLSAAGHVPVMTYQPGPHQAALSQHPHVERIADEQTLSASLDISARAFGLPLDATQRTFTMALLNGPGVDGFLVRREGNPVGTVWTTRAGRTVGIWLMATMPEEQRKGVGHALLTHVLAYHQERSATLFYLLATEAGYPLYERIGFRTVAQPAAWVAGHSVQVAG